MARARAHALCVLGQQHKALVINGISFAFSPKKEMLVVILSAQLKFTAGKCQPVGQLLINTL
jgi:hypothetical protein